MVNNNIFNTINNTYYNFKFNILLSINHVSEKSRLYYKLIKLKSYKNAIWKIEQCVMYNKIYLI